MLVGCYRWVLGRIVAGHFLCSCLFKLAMHVGTFGAFDVPLARACCSHARVGRADTNVLGISSLFQLFVTELVRSISVSSAEDRFVVGVFPLLPGVLAIYAGVLTSILILTNWVEVHVPHAHNEIAELVLLVV